jgi:hypothetical protein
MVHYLFGIVLCVSTITFCAEPFRNNPRLPRERNSFDKIDQIEEQKVYIIAMLQMKDRHKLIHIGDSYCLQNRRGIISEQRKHPITNKIEKRTFTSDDIAEFSFDHPKLPVNIVLKKK